MAEALPNPTPPSEKAVTRLGKYTILSRIATGGMSVIYRAVDENTGRLVALKVLPADRARNPVLRKRFDREAQTAARVRHENVVAVYELGKVSGTRYIAMELVEGLNLHQYIQDRGKLDVSLAMEILRQAALALHQAHKKGIVHRDIKPANFLIADREGRPLVKLADLGLARDERSEDDGRLTKTHTTLGTADYMAPEQAKGSWLADIRSDLYALGCTFYHMLTGRPPFPDGTAVAKFYKHNHATPEDPRDFNPQISDDVLVILAKLMQKKPADRFQTPRDLLLDLKRLERKLARQAVLEKTELMTPTPVDATPTPVDVPETAQTPGDVWQELAGSAIDRRSAVGNRQSARAANRFRNLHAFFEQPLLVGLAGLVMLMAIIGILYLLLQ